jgi:hypothetical protein
MSGFRAVTAFLLVGLVGCGAKVVFVGEDGGEGGATGVTNVASSSSGSGTQTSASTTSGFMSPCARLCMDHAACFGGGDCLSQCEALYVAGCEDDTSQFILCLAHNFGPNCELGIACDGELAVYDDCVAPTIDCVETACEIERPQSCVCTGSCAGTTISQRCEINDDFFTCECEVDGVSIGECVESQLQCELDPSCCKDLWLLGQG